MGSPRRPDRGDKGDAMPELCRFYGLIMTIYWKDHNPPHFHARYGEHVAEIDIRTLAVCAEACRHAPWL